MTSAQLVLSKYRELLRLIHRLPDREQATARAQATTLFRSRSQEQNPQTILDHQRELASKIAYLKVITPKQPGEGTGTFVLRDGKLVKGSGAARSSRVADGVISTEEAMQRNNRDFQRFYGGKKPSNVFF